ncbi:DUF6338 family protein [Actinopolymorpha rutila]|uniref:Uncharacterized protein n=1 Tax=Actinopolymorpha rutila TaxID=446787 RepID=A0A852ZIU7_9ACTN|nr:hypothetical protein [Actinopolymorpha rutila]
MVPDTRLSILLFAVLVAPGLLFDLLSERRRAAYSESAFREASRVVLSSVILSGVSVVAVLWIGSLKKGWLPDTRKLLEGNKRYYLDHARELLILLTLEVALAFLLAWFANMGLAQMSRKAKIREPLSRALTGGGSIRATSNWYRAFRQECPSGHDPYVTIRLRPDGPTYFGKVAYYTADMKAEGRELVLRQPIQVKSAKDKKYCPLSSDYQRIVIRADAIDVIYITYRKKNTQSADKPHRSKAKTGRQVEAPPAVGEAARK